MTARRTVTGKRAFWQLQVAALSDDLRVAKNTLFDATEWLAEVKARIKTWQGGRKVWGCELKPAQKRLRNANEHVSTVKAALAYAKGQAK